MYTPISIENALTALKQRLQEEQQIVHEVYLHNQEIKKLQLELENKEHQLKEQSTKLRVAMDRFRVDCKVLDSDQFNIETTYKKEIEPELSRCFIDAVEKFLEFCLKDRDAIAEKFKPLIKEKKTKASEVKPIEEDQQSIGSSNESGSQSSLNAYSDNPFLSFIAELQNLTKEKKYRYAGELIKRFVKTEEDLRALKRSMKPTRGKVFDTKVFFESRQLRYKNKQDTISAYEPILKLANQSQVLVLFEKQRKVSKVTETKVENEFADFMEQLDHFFVLFDDSNETYILAVPIVEAFLSPPLDNAKALAKKTAQLASAVVSFVKREKVADFLAPVKDIEAKHALLNHHKTYQLHMKERDRYLNDIAKKVEQQQAAFGRDIDDPTSIDELRKKTLIREVKNAIKERLNKGNYSRSELWYCYKNRGKRYAITLLKKIHSAQSYAEACNIIIEYIDGQIDKENRLKGNQLRYRDKSLSTYLLKHLFNGIYAPRPTASKNASEYYDWLLNVDTETTNIRNSDTVAIVNTITAPTRSYGCGIFAYRKQAAPTCRVDAMNTLKNILQEQIQNSMPTTTV